jgi:hypothetical protein
LSDPFHVTNMAGHVRRRGVVVDRDGACLTLRDADGYTYTLVGDLGELGAGDEVTVEGPYSEAGLCSGGRTIDVVRIISPGP